MSPPKTEKGKRRRQALIEATARLLNSVGYRELTVSDIASEVTAPVSLFYRYFRNKAEVVAEALEQVVAEHKARMPTRASSFFDFEVAAHRSLMDLFTKSPGLLSCYYSFDYSESAFAEFFHDHTLRFNQMHAERALSAATKTDPALSVDALMPLAHALTAMTDNFVFRYCTGRDETAALERAARTDVAKLLAQIRVRAFLLSDQNVDVSLLPPPGRAGVPRRMSAVTPVNAPAPILKRLPKRADSAASYEALTTATLRVMNRLSYDEMRIKDIEEEGGVTRGGIYHYFGEKRDLVILLLRERLAAMHTRLEAAVARPAASQFRALEAVIAVFLDEYQTNPGILRILYRIEQDDAEAADLLASYRQSWARAIADLCICQLGAESHWRSTLILVGYAMLAMVERFAYDLHVLPFTEISSRIPGPERSRFLAAIWMRALFLARPKAADFRARELLPRIQP